MPQPDDDVDDDHNDHNDYIYNDDDGGVKKPELVKADLVCWAGQAAPENISLSFHFLFRIISFIIC